MKKLEDVKYKEFIPTFDEMIATVHEAFSNELFSMYPWNAGETPTIGEIVLVYKDKPVSLTGYYLTACILLDKEVPKKYKKSIEKQVDPESYYKTEDNIEKLLLMDFEVFLTINPTLEEAVAKLIQLSKYYWQEDLSPELAEKQIIGKYKHKFGKKIII
jgi:hypothetical protein